jgi:hypothetical protein
MLTLLGPRDGRISMALGRIGSIPWDVYETRLLENTKTVMLIDALDESQNSHKTDNNSYEARIFVQLFEPLLEIASLHDNSPSLFIKT